MVIQNARDAGPFIEDILAERDITYRRLGEDAFGRWVEAVA
jgi:hypothetical protein